MSKLILGIDEAGRGPVLGPMVMAGVMVNESNIDLLKEAGANDSKLLTPKRRQEIFPKIKEIALRYEIIEIPAEEIDSRYAVATNLNVLEAIKMADIINKLKPDIAIVDCPSRNTGGFEKILRRYLSHDCKIKCENYADETHVIVGAASILAKVTRDSIIRQIEESLGEQIGSGYPDDPKTLKFLNDLFVKHPKDVRRFVRKSWLTYQRIRDGISQKRMDAF